MKKTTLFFMVFMYAGISWGQKYVPFPTENVEWNIFYASKGQTGIKIDTTLSQYSLHGDTTINGIVYRKLCKNTGSIDVPRYTGVGGLREQDRKIYYVGADFISHQGNYEFLLYDFNKQVGDTVWMSRYNQKYVIEAIDSVKIGQEFRKRYKITGILKHNPDYLIEGIGSVNDGLLGLITAIPTCLDCVNDWEFVSFSKNKVCIYKNPDYTDCTSTLRFTGKKYFGNDNIWYYREDFVIDDDHFTTVSHEELQGDTLINGKTYQKFSNRAALIREENQKVYVLLNNNTDQPNEFLLYDFSVQVGDTIHSNALHGSISRLPRVNRIETITFRNGEKRKQINLDGDLWIEGIGSKYGFFYSYNEHVTCDCGGSTLISFTRDDQLIYNDSALCASTMFCKNPVQGIHVLEEDKQEQIIYPNPAFDKISISTGILSEPCTFELMDVRGYVILRKEINANNNSVNLSGYTGGLYLYRLLLNGKMVKAGKIVKM